MENNRLTPEERREIESYRAQVLSSMPDKDFRRFVDLVRKEQEEKANERNRPAAGYSKR